MRRAPLKLGTALAAAAGAYALVEPSLLRVRREEIASERWPAGLDGLRVGVVSDLHAGAPHVRRNAGGCRRRRSGGWRR